jgi:enterochelin esterase-like enzyme
MRLPAIGFGLIGGLRLAAAAAGAVEPAPLMTWDHPPSEPLPLEVHGTYHSALLKTEVGYNIYLPPGYATHPDRRYPVIYWCHGRGHSESSGQFPAQIVDDGIRSKILPPLIVVYLCGGEVSFYSDSADGQWPVESSIVSELIPHIDATYRTEAVRGSRAIQGMSMGGFGALKLALKHPDLFSSVVAFAAGLREPEEMEDAERIKVLERIFGGDPANFLANCPKTLVEKAAPAQLAQLGILLICGLQDGLLEGSRKLHRALEEKKAAFEHVELPGCGHDLPMLASEVGPAGLEFAVCHFRMSKAADADGPWVNTPIDPVPECRHHLFFSEAMKRPVGYNIYLPPDYAARPEARYPVVYYLPGMRDTESNHLGIAGHLDHAIRSGQVAPMIWVSVYAGRTSCYTDGANGVKGETVLINELIPQIDARWRTRAAREGRGIEGFGTGGAGAFRLAAKHPDRFCSAVSVSGTFYSLGEMKSTHADQLARLWADAAAFEADSARTLLAKNAEALRTQVAWRQVVGAQDPLLEANRRLHAEFERLRIPVVYDELAGLGHDPAALFMRCGVAGWQFHSARFAGNNE